MNCYSLHNIAMNKPVTYSRIIIINQPPAYDRTITKTTKAIIRIFKNLAKPWVNYACNHLWDSHTRT